MKLSLSKECGNSPKNKLVQDLAVALELGDADFLEASITNDAQWEIAGSEPLEGRGRILEAFSDSKSEVESLEIDRVLSHGRSGAVNGKLVVTGGSRRAFCHVFEFSNTKGVAVRRIISYFVTD